MMEPSTFNDDQKFETGTNLTNDDDYTKNNGKVVKKFIGECSIVDKTTQQKYLIKLLSNDGKSENECEHILENSKSDITCVLKCVCTEEDSEGEELTRTAEFVHNTTDESSNADDKCKTYENNDNMECDIEKMRSAEYVCDTEETMIETICTCECTCSMGEFDTEFVCTCVCTCSTQESRIETKSREERVYTSEGSQVNKDKDSVCTSGKGETKCVDQFTVTSLAELPSPTLLWAAAQKLDI